MRQSRPLLALAAALLGCAGEPEPSAPMEATLDALSVEGLEVAPAGELAGDRFQAKSAYYRVISYEGRERVDLYFDDPAPERCGLPVPRSTRRVFLRFPGNQGFDTGETAVAADADDPPFTVHYEAPADHGWRGRVGGVAKLAIDEVDDRVVRGRLHVCFDDGQQSCVRGAFEATQCITRVDGQAIREGVGLHEPLPEDVRAAREATTADGPDEDAPGAGEDHE